MSEVAQALEIHEATVSRITAGKYLQCNFGIFPLRYFLRMRLFQQKKNTKKTGKVFSKEEVKQRLLLIIEEAEKEGKNFLMKNSLKCLQNTVCLLQDGLYQNIGLN